MKTFKSCLIFAGSFVMTAVLPASAAFTFSIGTPANTAAPITSSALVSLDVVGAATVGASSPQSTNATSPYFYDHYSVTGSAADGFGSSVSIQLQAARPINTTDGSTGAALTGTTTMNSLGMGVTGTGGGANANGNFLGSSGTIYEGILLSIDTSGMGAGYQLQLKGYAINLSAANVTYSSGIINRVTSTSENFSSAIAAIQLQSFSLASPITIDGGNSLTQIATFWQPDNTQSGYRLKSLTFDIVAVPEPSVITLAGMGIATLLVMRRNGRR